MRLGLWPGLDDDPPDFVPLTTAVTLCSGCAVLSHDEFVAEGHREPFCDDEALAFVQRDCLRFHCYDLIDGFSNSSSQSSSVSSDESEACSCWSLLRSLFFSPAMVLCQWCAVLAVRAAACSCGHRGRFSPRPLRLK